MTGNEVARYSDPDSWVEILGPVGDLASKISGTEFIPRALRGKPAAVAAAVLSGRELGLPPLTSLRAIHVIEGTPSLSAEMLFALVLNAGHQVAWIEAGDERATVRITRCDGLAEATASYSMKDARVAGLVNKDNWRKHPRNMLRWRAITEAVSMACPDIALALPGAVFSDEPTPQAPTTATVVQVQRNTPAPPPPEATQPADDVVEGEVVPEPTPADQPAQEPDTQPVEPVLVTPAQLRKINAQLGEWETLEGGQKMDRARRRRLIGFYAGAPDPDALESANQLTRDQASTAIEALTEALEVRRREADPEPVESEPVDTEGTP